MLILIYPERDSLEENFVLEEELFLKGWALLVLG
jgi:hypothetical protein